MSAAILVACDNSACGKTFRVKRELAGKRVKCPGCMQSLTVPASEDESTQRAISRGDSTPRQMSILWPTSTAVLLVVTLVAIAWSSVKLIQASSLQTQLQGAIDDADQKAIQGAHSLEKARADLEKAGVDLRAREQAVDTLTIQLEAAANRTKEIQQTVAKQVDAIRVAEKKVREAEAQIESLKQKLTEQEAQEKQALRRVETDSLDFEMKNLQGVWKVRKSFNSWGGQGSLGSYDVVVISENHLTYETGKMPHDLEIPYPVDIRVDPKQKPRVLDFVRPDYKKPILQGIYAWEGDLLRIHCGRDRPKDFLEKLTPSPFGSSTLSLLLEKTRSKPLPPFPKTTLADLTNTYWEVNERIVASWEGRPPLFALRFAGDNTVVSIKVTEINGIIQQTETPCNTEASPGFKPNGFTLLVSDKDMSKSRAWEIALNRDRTHMRAWDQYSRNVIWLERKKPK